MEVKLFDSNPRGLAEPIRLLLNDQQINYKEYSIPSDEWTQIEPKLVFGEVPFARPFLLWGDEEHCFAKCILRSLGRDIPDEEQALSMIGLNEQMFNFLEKYEPIINGTSANEKNNYINEKLSRKLNRFELVFCAYRNEVPENQKSYVDYALFEMLDLHMALVPNALDSTPVLKKFYEKFSELPNIKKYLENRNTTSFPGKNEEK